MLGKVTDCGIYIRYLIADMVCPSAPLEYAINGGIWPKRRHQFENRVSPTSAKKADRYVLNWIVKNVRYWFVLK